MREQLRTTFTQDAELYDSARPAYPAAVFDDLAELTGMKPGCRVLEIGCGTGKATLPLAERGCQVVAVELGAQMAAMARRTLAGFPQVDVVTCAFEDWPLPDEPFDLVVAAASFHWVDPAVRTIKAADALRVGGALATITLHHVNDGYQQLFDELDTCWARWAPGVPTVRPSAVALALEAEQRRRDRSDRFGPAVVRRYAWRSTYSTVEFLNLTRTYSRFRLMSPHAQRGLLGCLQERIISRHGGRVTKPHLAELHVAFRRV